MKKGLKKLVILFLLIQGGLYSNDLNITSDYTNDSYVEYINTKGNETNIYIDNNNVFFINNGLIDITYEDKNNPSSVTVAYKGNGINIKENNKNIKIENTGTVLGKLLLAPVVDSVAGNFSGNALSFGSTINKLKNSGLISGNALLTNQADKTKANYNGNGLDSNDNSTIENIENIGFISGKAELKSGAMVNGSFSQADYSGNGISFKSNGDETISAINIGSILGEVLLEGVNNNNYSFFQEME